MAESERVEMDVKKSFIKKQNIFSELTEEEIEILSGLLVEKHFKPGETIVTEGDRVDSVYFIVKGEADIRHVTIQNGATHTESVATVKEGAAIGLNETGFYSISGVRTATVCAITPLITLRLSVAAFHGFALSNSHVSSVMRDKAFKMLGLSSNTNEN